MCYCYNDECNRRYEKENNINYKAAHISEPIFTNEKTTPKCPYCKKKMTRTASINEDDTY